MKFTVEADCTPAEARAFLGLPDITPLNDQMVQGDVVADELQPVDDEA